MDKYSKKNLEELKEPASSTKANEFKELGVAAMVRGIGRKVTDEEMLDYLLKDQHTEQIDVEVAFSKYSGK